MSDTQVSESFDFDAAKYMSTRLRVRTADVAAKELATWYPKKANPTIRVRGMTGAEIAKVREAVEMNESLTPLIKSLNSGDPDAVASMKGLHALISGAAGRNPSEYIRQLNIVKHGCDKPKFKHDQVVRIAQDFPVLFGQLSRKILELTGLGRITEK